MASERLNVTDVCDVVEFHESADGVALYGQEGRWALSAQRGGKKMDYVTHLKPDGDAVGSSLSLVRALNSPGPWVPRDRAQAWYAGPTPPWPADAAGR